MKELLAKSDFRIRHVYMAKCAIAPLTSDPDSFHDWYLDLQELMRQTIVFQAEIMGGTMYFY